MAGRIEPPDALDYFPTPPFATRALCECVLGIDRARPLSSSVWEPAAGGSHMAEVLKEYFTTVHASDVHDYGCGYEVGSFIGQGATKSSRRAMSSGSSPIRRSISPASSPCVRSSTPARASRCWCDRCGPKVQIGIVSCSPSNRHPSLPNSSSGCRWSRAAGIPPPRRLRATRGSCGDRRSPACSRLVRRNTDGYRQGGGRR